MSSTTFTVPGYNGGAPWTIENAKPVDSTMEGIDPRKMLLAYAASMAAERALEMEGQIALIAADTKQAEAALAAFQLVSEWDPDNWDRVKTRTAAAILEAAGIDFKVGIEYVGPSGSVVKVSVDYPLPPPPTMFVIGTPYGPYSKSSDPMEADYWYFDGTEKREAWYIESVVEPQSPETIEGWRDSLKRTYDQFSNVSTMQTQALQVKKADHDRFLVLANSLIKIIGDAFKTIWDGAR